MDTGYYAFINSFRVAESKELLMSDREMRVIDIVYAVGFKSLSVFYKAFHDETGMSPKEFQKNLI
jgi:AraC-like DNA-binding protein